MIESGAALGLLGRLIDFVGKVTGWRSEHRRAAFEQQRMEEALKETIAELVPLLERAKKSYERLAAAEGRFRSGAAVAWFTRWEADLAEAKAIMEESDVLGVDCSRLKPGALNKQKLVVDKVQRRVAKLTGYYEASLATDRAGVERRIKAMEADAAAHRQRRDS